MTERDLPLSRAEIQAADWLVRLQMGDGSERAAFEAWLSGGPANAAAFEAVKASVATTRVAAESELVRTSRLHRAGFLERRRGTAYAIAASLAALSAVGGGIAVRELATIQAPRSTDRTDVYATRTGAVRQLRLADGSRVTLDADSLLRVTYTADARGLRLDRGRARFEVAHDPARPFIVGAGNGSVIAHGTVFDVSVRPSGVRVVLIEGVIEVMKGRDTAQPVNVMQSRRLRPGQQVTFDDQGAIPEPTSAPPTELQWTAGMLTFDRARLADAVAEINRHSTRRIRLASPELGDLRIGGGFRAGDVEGFARAIAASLDLRVEIRPDGILLAPADRSNR